MERLQLEVAEALKKTRGELAAADTLIRKFDARLDPARIAPIRAWAKRYGKGVALKEAIQRCRQEVFPEDVSITEIAVWLQAELGLDFATHQACEERVRSSGRAQLLGLVREGVAERVREQK